MRGRHAFLRIWIVSLAGLLVLVGAVNLCVDPYVVFGMPRIAGLNRVKPATKNHAMLAKAGYVKIVLSTLTMREQAAPR